MNISPAVSGITASPAGISSLQGASGVGEAASGTFEAALDSVGGALAEADLLSQQVATGQITDLSQLTAAAAKAELGVQLTVAFRDRAVDSFQQIMRMQI